jgi:signal recognition particle subunit SRP72
MQAFERAYNAACGCIARQELGQAEILLNRAKRNHRFSQLVWVIANIQVELCAASPDLSPDDKKAELLPIMVQLIYVLARQGKKEEAGKLCDTIELNE